MGTTRRMVLGSLAAVSGLAVGWSLLPVRQRLTGHTPPPVASGQMPFNGWVAIDGQGIVTVLMPKSEMGQGTHTGLAMLLAEELDADWASVRIGEAPVDPIYNNLATVVDGLPFHPDDTGLLKQFAGWMTAKVMREVGVMMTGGSSSLKDLWLPMRRAGASARAMLVGAAAQQWGVSPEQITVASGRVSHASSGRSLGFGELAQAAGRLPVVQDPPLKPASAFKLIGTPQSRLDSVAKSNGLAGFGIDMQRPGMRVAAVRMAPDSGGQVASMDAAAAQKLPGIRAVLTVPASHGGSGAVAVIADTWWQAHRALDQVQIRWQPGPAAGLSSGSITTQLQAALASGKAHAFRTVGDVESAMQQAARRVQAEYRAPYLAHAPMEPMNCTVQVDADQATVWAPTQVPDLARAAVAQITGLDAKRVTVHVPFLGGGFGRRLDVDFIAQASFIANAVRGVPVKTIWSREDDMANDFYRPACVARFEAGLDARNQPVAWQLRTAGQAIIPAYAKRVLGLSVPGPDKTTSEGAFDQPYEFAACRIEHAAVELPVPIGFWRSVGHSHQAFFKECFVDEVASAAGQDPVAFRAAMLARHPRHLKVLQRAAALGQWGSRLEPRDGMRRGRGVALHQSFGSIVAQVVEVSVDASGALQVDRIVCVIDCGQAVNPNLIAQQVDSAIVYGLSAALHGDITLADGRVQQSNFHDYRVLKMAECPPVQTEIIASSEPPEGVGEPPLPPVAPALANAVFAATGTRLRSLPLRLS